MSNTVWSEYLQEKKDNKERIKVFLKSRKQKNQQKIISTMLSGYVHSFDEDTLRLEKEECIIERNEIFSIKPFGSSDDL